jgi:hypothetical protein
MALSRRKKPAVPAGSRSTAPGRGPEAPQRPQTGAQRLAKGPRLCPRVHRQSQANNLLSAAGNSVRPKLGRRFRQVVRSSPQSWIRKCPTLLSHLRQSTGACLVTCPGV